MLETIVVILVIALAAAYVARNFYRKFGSGKPQNAGCGCTNSDCGMAQDCHPGSNSGSVPENCPACEDS